MNKKSDSKYLTLNNLKGWAGLHKGVTLYYPPIGPSDFNVQLIHPR